MRLSIIIPANNEESSIGKILQKVSDLKIPEKEIIVINDGSTDHTKEILEKLKQTLSFKLAHHDKNLGKGAAIKTGLNEVTGDLVIIQDADLEYEPSDIPLLLEKISDGVAAVYGNRGSKRWPERGLEYILGAKILTLCVNTLYRTNLNDVYTGYKLFNLKQVPLSFLLGLKSSGFEFEGEVTCKILNRRGKIIEVPISFTPRSKAEGKHIRFWDGIIGVFTILRFFFFPKQP